MKTKRTEPAKVVLPIRFKPDDLKRAQAKAELADLPVSTWIRQVVCKELKKQEKNT